MLMAEERLEGGYDDGAVRAGENPSHSGWPQRRPRLKSLHANLSAYDAQYVALAEALHLSLVTADARIDRSGPARCTVEVFGAHS